MNVLNLNRQRARNAVVGRHKKDFEDQVDATVNHRVKNTVKKIRQNVKSSDRAQKGKKENEVNRQKG